ncbi:alpha/beta fold hydrolase [Exilibacterium tricleocarpae]|uniref:Alpha/beta fold hydrolase n=1 Tax=Exilibacterium tricleocarpae TaxID=2591008 RepID=A0A545TVD8_9GAMM|nr:alpha/beta fold hydrolase [Exilibacterium tricleocarpae]TQV81180.1 alpha/beta fold hydrolase [Exilibacterium tricleocarpae]
MERIPLLLLPGTLCDARLWRHQQQALADLAAAVVMPVGTDSSLGALAENILRQAPPRFALAGLSFGGILAFEILRRAPQRISHLALLDTNARADTSVGTEAKREQLELAAERGLETLLREKLIPAYLFPAHLANDELVQTIVDMALDSGIDVFKNQVQAVVERPDSLGDLAGIHCPTLVLCGRQDGLCPPDRHEEMAARIPNANLCIVENCGHLSTLEQPAAVNAALREWLTRKPLR